MINCLAKSYDIRDGFQSAKNPALTVTSILSSAKSQKESQFHAYFDNLVVVGVDHPNKLCISKKVLTNP